MMCSGLFIACGGGGKKDSAGGKDNVLPDGRIVEQRHEGAELGIPVVRVRLSGDAKLTASDKYEVTTKDAEGGDRFHIVQYKNLQKARTHIFNVTIEKTQGGRTISEPLMMAWYEGMVKKDMTSFPTYRRCDIGGPFDQDTRTEENTLTTYWLLSDTLYNWAADLKKYWQSESVLSNIIGSSGYQESADLHSRLITSLRNSPKLGTRPEYSQIVNELARCHQILQIYYLKRLPTMYEAFAKENGTLLASLNVDTNNMAAVKSSVQESQNRVSGLFDQMTEKYKRNYNPEKQLFNTWYKIIGDAVK